MRQQGSPKHTKVFYTHHTTSDVALAVRTKLGADAIVPKSFSSVRFAHTAGTSIQKGTSCILDCWVRRPDLPPVDICIAEELYQSQFASYFDPFIKRAKNIALHVGKLDSTQFGKLIDESAFFLCPSSQEGYGRYINQTRVSSGVILTADSMGAKKYEAMAAHVYQQFLFDTIFFAQKMQKLHEFARAKSHHYLRQLN